MPYNFFYSLSKEIENENEMNKMNDIPQIKESPRISKAPTTSVGRSMKKIKSEEDFVKLQVPWIM